MQEWQVFSTQDCKMVAEDGYSLMEPPHTYRAFLAASNRPFLGMKFSVRFTKDHIPIASSKPYLTLRKKKYYISKTSLSTFEEIGVFAFPNEVTCKLVDFLNLCRAYKKRPFIELNRATSYKEIDSLWEIVMNNHLSSIVKIISPKLEYLAYLRQKDFNMELQYLVDRYSDEAFLECCKYHLDLFIKTQGLSSFVHQDLVSLCHDYKLKVACGPTEKEEVAIEYLNRGVDYLFSGGLK